MTIFDWNQDGKIDMQDDFLEYNIFKACTEDDDNGDLFDSDDEFDEEWLVCLIGDDYNNFY